MSERYQLDPAHTAIGFTAKHLAVTSVRGNFQKFEGWVAADRNDPASLSGEITIDIASLTTGSEQRDGHLKSADFFESDGHPKAIYRPTRAEQTGTGTYRVSGDLTIKNVCRELVLTATVSEELDHPFQPGSKIVSVEATGSLNRKEFGLNWDGLAGTIPLASNEIKLQIDAELVRTAQTADAATA